MSDLSNFDIIKCKEKGCEFYHILLTDGYKTKKEALDEIYRMIKDDMPF